MENFEPPQLQNSFVKNPQDKENFYYGMSLKDKEILYRARWVMKECAEVDKYTMLV